MSDSMEQVKAPTTVLDDVKPVTTILPFNVVVHPLVLLSTVDHYNRVAKDTKKRVVGVLLGEVHKGVVDVTNSYALPFEEDEKDQKIWFLDHTYHESMGAMFRKVSAKEKLVGWYSTGPKIKSNDLAINDVFRRYTPNPVMVIIEVQPNELEIPTKAYVATEEVREDQTEEPKLAFKHISSEIGALEAEEVGVEHLLRDVKDTSISTLTTKVNEKHKSVRSLINHLKSIHTYLTDVVNGKLPVNNQILFNLQDIFNLAPNLNLEEVSRAFATKTNDMMLILYLSSMIRSIIALHNLLNNKIENREAEKNTENPEKKDDKEDKKEEKDSAKTEKSDEKKK